MEKATQSANALNTHSIRGDTYAIEAVTSDGTKVLTLARMTCEIAEFLSDYQWDYVKGLFAKFCEEVKDGL